jgi:hypothetical protein
MNSNCSKCSLFASRMFDADVKVEINLRPTVSQPVRFDDRRPSGTRDQFFFLLEIFFRQLCVCYFVTPSLTRERVCNILYNFFCALPEQSLLGRSPAQLMNIFTVSFETPPTWRVRFPYLYPPGTGWPSYTPWHWVLFDSEVEVEVEVNLRPTASRPVRLGIGPPSGTLDQILSCSSFFCWQLLDYSS